MSVYINREEEFGEDNLFLESHKNNQIEIEVDLKEFVSTVTLRDEFKQSFTLDLKDLKALIKSLKMAKKASLHCLQEYIEYEEGQCTCCRSVSIIDLIEQAESL